MKSILIISGHARSVSNFRGDLIKRLLVLGYRVHVGVPTSTEEKYEQRIKALGPVVIHKLSLDRTSLNPVTDLLLIKEIRQLYKSTKIGSVLLYNVKPVVFGGISALGLKINLTAMITGVGYGFTEGSSVKRKFVKMITRALYHLSFLSLKKVIFQNDDDMRLFETMGLIPNRISKFIVNGSGVNLAHFTWSPVDPQVPSFLMISRLLGDKGVREYLAAAKIIKSSFHQANFALLGDFDDNPDAVSAKELQPYIDSGTVFYPGRVDDVRPYIQKCNVYVLPSYREGTPRSVLESMAVGRAIITTDAPGCRQTTINGVNGYIVPVKNAAELALAMEKFVVDPVKTVSFGAQSRIIAEERYDVIKVNDQMIKIIEEGQHE